MKEFNPLQYFLYLSCLTVIITSLFFDKHYLSILLPITLLFLLLTYLYQVFKRKHLKINFFFIISVMSLMISDHLIYVSFTDYFSYMCICIIIYALFSSLALKKYCAPITFRWKTTMTLPLFISIGLLGYLIFSISDLVLELLPNTIPYIVSTILTLLLYAGISYYIYVSDTYSHGIKLLISAFLCQFVVGFTVINELFLLNNFCTFFIVSAHILGIYIFMKFLVEQDPTTIQDSIKKHLL